MWKLVYFLRPKVNDVLNPSWEPTLKLKDQNIFQEVEIEMQWEKRKMHREVRRSSIFDKI